MNDGGPHDAVTRNEKKEFVKRTQESDCSLKPGYFSRALQLQGGDAVGSEEDSMTIGTKNVISRYSTHCNRSRQPARVQYKGTAVLTTFILLSIYIVIEDGMKVSG